MGNDESKRKPPDSNSGFNSNTGNMTYRGRVSSASSSTSNTSFGNATHEPSSNNYTRHSNVNRNFVNTGACDNASMYRPSTPHVSRERPHFSKEDVPASFKMSVGGNADSHNRNDQNSGQNLGNTEGNVGILHNKQYVSSHCGIVKGKQNIETFVVDREGVVYPKNTTENVFSDSPSHKQNVRNDLLQKDTISLEELFKTATDNNNLTQGSEKFKNFREESVHSGTTGKKIATCEYSKQVQKTQSTATQNLIVDDLQTFSLDSKNYTNDETNSQIHDDATKQRGISSDMLSENTDKTAAACSVSSDYAKANDLNCLDEQKLQNSIVDNELPRQSCGIKDSAYSYLQQELLEISLIERLNIDNRKMSELPALTEKCQNELSKETENVIIDSVISISNLIDSLSELPVHSVTSSVSSEIINLSQKIDKFISSLDKGAVKNKGIVYGKNLNDPDRHLFEQRVDLESKCSLHCNFCKTSIVRYKDIEKHINSKCKNVNNKTVSEKNQNRVDESINKKEIILQSMIYFMTEDLRDDKPYISIVQNNFYCSACQVSFPLHKMNLEDHITGRNHIKNKEKCNAQTNTDVEINDSSVPPTGNIQSNTDLPINYRLLMESLVENRNFENEHKTESMYYVCRACDYVTKTQKDWKAHIINSSHQNNTVYLKDVKTHHCSVCGVCLYGDSAAINEHNLLREHCDKVNSKCINLQKSSPNKINDDVSNQGEVNKETCSDTNTEDNFNKHEYFLKVLLEKKITHSGPRGFYCKPCNYFSYYSETKGSHISMKKHQQKFRRDPQLCKQFYCDSCHVHLYGDVSILSEHNAIKYHRLMDNKKQEVDKSSVKNVSDTRISSKNIIDTGVSSNNVASDSLLHAHLKENTKINSQENEIRFVEKSISVLEILESQSKLDKKIQNISKNRTRNKNTEKDLSSSSKSSENMQNLLFDNGFKMNGYFCRPCSVSVEARKEWNQHIKSQSHRARMHWNENRKFKHPKLCYTCKIVFICDDSAFKRHLSSVCHQEQLELDKEVKNTVKHQDSNSVVSENETYDNESDSEETDISSSDNAVDISNSEGEEEEEGNVEEQDNMEEDDSVDEEDNMDEISNMSYGLTDDFTSDSHSVSSVQSSRQKKYVKQTQRKKETKGNKNTKVMPKGLHIGGLKPGTTHVHIFHALKMYGHIQYVDINYGKKDSALVIYKRGSDVDKIVKDNVPLMVNGWKIKIIETVDSEFLPCCEEEYVLPDAVIKLFNSEGTVCKFMDELLKKMEDCSRVEKRKADLLINDIKVLLPECSVYPFGSRVTGIAMSTSDLDLYIDIGDKMYNGDSNQEPEQQALLIEVLSGYFSSQQANGVFSDMQLITGARVPIIKLRHTLSGLNCDISCRNGLSVENTKLISLYLQLDARVKWLVVAVKTWAHQVNIADRTMFTSYALIWLVLFFLMQLKTPLVCSVSDLRSKNSGYSRFIAGWDCTFCRNPDLIPPSRNTESSIELLHDFFEFYGAFPFRKYVLSPLMGKILHRAVFKTIADLPSQLRTYATKCNNNPHVNSLQINTPMCLQDPFDLSHNITRGVKGPVLKKFVALCNKSAQLCENWK